MKITLSQNRLAQGLNYTARAVSNKPNIPVLSNILLEVSKNEMRLSATNLDMGINMWIGGQVEEEGKVTASGKFLADFINATGEGKVEISLKEDVVHVTTEKSQADFHTIAASEFPILPKAAGEPFFTIDTKDFVEAMDKVIFVCSTDLVSSSIQFTGVLFELEEDKKSQITFVGLDGYRLSKKTAKIKRHQNGAQQLIVPARALQELVKILVAENDDKIEVYLSESKTQVIFKFSDLEFSIRLLEGPYPDYKRVIPTERSFGYEVAKTELEKAMKIVNTFARSIPGSKVDIDLDLETSVLKINCRVPDLGETETQLTVQNASGASDLKAAYNLQFFIDMINHTTGNKLTFETNGPLAPAVFTDEQDKDFVHIIMPVKRTV